MLPGSIVVFAAGCCFMLLLQGLQHCLVIFYESMLQLHGVAYSTVWMKTFEDSHKPILTAQLQQKGSYFATCVCTILHNLATLKSSNSPFWCHEDIVKSLRQILVWDYFILFHQRNCQNTNKIILLALWASARGCKQRAKFAVVGDSGCAWPLHYRAQDGKRKLWNENDREPFEPTCP